MNKIEINKIKRKNLLSFDNNKTKKLFPIVFLFSFLLFFNLIKISLCFFFHFLSAFWQLSLSSLSHKHLNYYFIISISFTGNWDKESQGLACSSLRFINRNTFVGNEKTSNNNFIENFHGFFLLVHTYALSRFMY